MVPCSYKLVYKTICVQGTLLVYRLGCCTVHETEIQVFMSVVQCQNNNWLISQDIYKTFIWLSSSLIRFFPLWPLSTISFYVVLVLSGQSWHAKTWNMCFILFHFCQTKFKTSQRFWKIYCRRTSWNIPPLIWSNLKYCFYWRLLFQLI